MAADTGDGRKRERVDEMTEDEGVVLVDVTAAEKMEDSDGGGGNEEEAQQQGTSEAEEDAMAEVEEEEAIAETASAERAEKKEKDLKRRRKKKKKKDDGDEGNGDGDDEEDDEHHRYGDQRRQAAAAAGDVAAADYPAVDVNNYIHANQQNSDTGAGRPRRRAGLTSRRSYLEIAGLGDDYVLEDLEWEGDDDGPVDENEDFCTTCGVGGTLLCCDTCPASHHLACLDPPLKRVPKGKWSCPTCQDPLADVDKLVDWREKFTDCDLGGDVTEECADVNEAASEVKEQSAAMPMEEDGDKKEESPVTPVGEDASKMAASHTALANVEYLVKWKSRSYLHCTWISHEALEKAARKFPGLSVKLRKFQRQIMAPAKEGDDVDGDNETARPVSVRPEWMIVDRVIDSRTPRGGEIEYLVKWKDLGYDEASWEKEEDISAFKLQLNAYHSLISRDMSRAEAKQKSQRKQGRKRKSPEDVDDKNNTSKNSKPISFTALEATPQNLCGGELHPYQLEGVNWLRFSWWQGRHIILADEMGLGKTIQTIAFLASLKDDGEDGPHLVVAPLSTLRNWEREFSTWAPFLYVVMYVGTAKARSVIRRHEFVFHPHEHTRDDGDKEEGAPDQEQSKSKQRKKKQKKQKPVRQLGGGKQEETKFDVLLTSYEMIVIDNIVFRKIKWGCLVVDEGHRLKKKESKLFQTLHTYSTRHRLLLTGTPLQNNLDELFMLMHFLDAGKFSSLRDFQEEFADINHEEQIARLHELLAPHLLRRLKKDVMKKLPPKRELIVRVDLTPLQKTLYKAVLTKNYHVLCRRGGHQVSLSNVMMELRKVCAHPFLIQGAEPEVEDANERHRLLVELGGKFALVSKMMDKLKQGGHRVLIYSQFTRVLDLFEDWLLFKKWNYERIDGTVSGVERQIRIDRFNAPGSLCFIFLLSTRAGGLGINLATADTVVIFDSDWNPHNDLQAQARAHRLGQNKKVMIYRLVTRGTVEERIMQFSKKKMVLEHLVVQRMNKPQVLNQDELDDILRFGAKELFEEEDDENAMDTSGGQKKSRSIYYDDDAIDRLLDRSQVEDDSMVGEEEESDYLKGFKVARFEYMSEDTPRPITQDNVREDASPGSQQHALDLTVTHSQYWDELLQERYKEDQERQCEDLGKGKRSKKQVNYANAIFEMGNSSILDDSEKEESGESDDGGASSAKAGGDQKAGAGVQEDGAEGLKRKAQCSDKKKKTADSAAQVTEGAGESLRVLGFSQKHRAAFLKTLMRFGVGDFSWREFVPRLKPKTLEEIKEYGTLFFKHIEGEKTDNDCFSDGVPKEGLQVRELLVRLAVLHLIRDKVIMMSVNPSMPMFRTDRGGKARVALNKTKVWKEEQDRKLLRGILIHGYGRWCNILCDERLNLQEPLRAELHLPPHNMASSNVGMGTGTIQQSTLVKGTKTIASSSGIANVMQTMNGSGSSDRPMGGRQEETPRRCNTSPLAPAGVLQDGRPVSIPGHQSNIININGGDALHDQDFCNGVKSCVQSANTLGEQGCATVVANVLDPYEQRKMVDFIRKRVGLLEKVLDAEFRGDATKDKVLVLSNGRAGPRARTTGQAEDCQQQGVSDKNGLEQLPDAKCMALAIVPCEVPAGVRPVGADDPEKLLSLSIGGNLSSGGECQNWWTLIRGPTVATATSTRGTSCGVGFWESASSALGSRDPTIVIEDSVSTGAGMSCGDSISTEIRSPRMDGDKRAGSTRQKEDERRQNEMQHAWRNMSSFGHLTPNSKGQYVAVPETVILMSQRRVSDDAGGELRKDGVGGGASAPFPANIRPCQASTIFPTTTLSMATPLHSAAAVIGAELITGSRDGGVNSNPALHPNLHCYPSFQHPRDVCRLREGGGAEQAKQPMLSRFNSGTTSSPGPEAGVGSGPGVEGNVSRSLADGFVYGAPITRFVHGVRPVGTSGGSIGNYRPIAPAFKTTYSTHTIPCWEAQTPAATYAAATQGWARLVQGFPAARSSQFTATDWQNSAKARRWEDETIIGLAVGPASETAGSLQGRLAAGTQHQGQPNPTPCLGATMKGVGSGDNSPLIDGKKGGRISSKSAPPPGSTIIIIDD